MGQGEPKVYVLAAALKDTGICTQITEDAPVHNGAVALLTELTAGCSGGAVEMLNNQRYVV
jgi:hypothetical protein